MKTYQFEATHGQVPGNWGKFAVGVPDEEWDWTSGVDEGRPLLDACGWDRGVPMVWVFDIQTGESCFIRIGGSAHADLQRHRVWVCPLFEPWLEWLYDALRGHRDLNARLAELPQVVEFPDAGFAFAGYRRVGPPS